MNQNELFPNPNNHEITHGEEKMTLENEENKSGELSLKEQITQKLQEGIKRTLDSQEFANWCKKQGKLYYNNYSLTNAMLTYFQKPEATYVCGYEAWKSYGRQVVQGAQGIKIFTPVFAKEYGPKGSLLQSIKRSCDEQFKKNPSLEYAVFRLGQSKLFFNMYRNGLFDVKIGNEVKMAHITSGDLRKFLDQYIIGKTPVSYNVATVFDVSDTTNEVDFLWVHKDSCKKEEIALDEKGNPSINKRGQIKIINTEERKSKFNDINMELHEHDTEKMQILYETLSQICKNNGISLTESNARNDEVLAGGALGYYKRPNGSEQGNGSIVISEDLTLTEKVSVSFHEIAHSDMHRDLEKLKKDIGKDEITKQMREIQAEAVAFMTASTFGIETEHKSFAYISNWSDGRELKTLETSLDIIYKESRKLLKDIEKELDVKGFTMDFEPKDKTPIPANEKQSIIAEYKEFTINNLRGNEITQKSALEDLKSIDDNDHRTIIKEQIVLTRNIDEKIMVLDTKIGEFEKSEVKQDEIKMLYQMKAAKEQVKMLTNKVNDLSLERVELVREIAKRNKDDMKRLYADDPLKAMNYLKKNFPQMQSLTDGDLKYLAHSKYITKAYSKYLGTDNEKFVKHSLEQLDNLKKVLSKNKVSVEISKCEQWGDKPIFIDGTLAHPKEANKIIANAEKEVRAFKDIALKNGDYYPYTRCDLSIYTYTDNDDLIILNTKIDIGDKEQKDLKDHLEQICKGEEIKEKILASFKKSTSEKVAIPLIQIPTKEITKEKEKPKIQGNNVRSLSEWKNLMQTRQNDNKKSAEKEPVRNGEIPHEKE